MICARYAERPQEIEIEADQTGLAALFTLLSEGRGSTETSVPPGSAAPYAGYLDRVSVEIGGGLVSISIQGKSLRISGSCDSLSALARNVEAVMWGSPDASPTTIPYHVHVEYHPEHPYIDSDSIPVVLLHSRLDDGAQLPSP